MKLLPLLTIMMLPVGFLFAYSDAIGAEDVLFEDRAINPIDEEDDVAVCKGCNAGNAKKETDKVDKLDPRLGVKPPAVASGFNQFSN